MLDGRSWLSIVLPRIEIRASRCFGFHGQVAIHREPQLLLEDLELPSEVDLAVPDLGVEADLTHRDGPGVVQTATQLVELDTIPGVVPSLINLPPGCRFAARCRARVENELEICVQEEPRLEEVAPDHEVRCWLYAEGKDDD